MSEMNIDIQHINKETIKDIKAMTKEGDSAMVNGGFPIYNASFDGTAHTTVDLSELADDTYAISVKLPDGTYVTTCYIKRENNSGWHVDVKITSDAPTTTEIYKLAEDLMSVTSAKGVE